MDANQGDIVDALRRCGCTVVSTAAVGNGFTDIAVGVGGKTFLLEVKDGSLAPSARRLTDKEEKFHREWKGHAAVVNSVEEAFVAVGLMPA